MSRSPNGFCLFAVILTFCISGTVHAAVTKEDTQFLIKAAQSNVNEIRLSQLAEKKAVRPEVKAYAGKMASDHGMLQKKMQPFAMAWSVKLPVRPDAEHKAEYRKLRSLSGAAFDKEYMSTMDKDHNALLVAFTHEANIVTDPDFKSMVISAKSVIAAHTNMADDLKSKL